MPRMQPAQPIPRLTPTEAKVLEAFLTPEVTILAVAQALKLTIQELLDALTAPAIRAAFDTLSSLDAIRRRLSLAPVVPGALAALKRLLDLNDKPAEVRRAATTILNTYTRLERAPRTTRATGFGSAAAQYAPLHAPLHAPFHAPLAPAPPPRAAGPAPHVTSAHADENRGPRRPDAAIENPSPPRVGAETDESRTPQPAAHRTTSAPTHAPSLSSQSAFFVAQPSILGPQPAPLARAARLASNAGLAAAINNTG